MVRTFIFSTSRKKTKLSTISRLLPHVHPTAWLIGMTSAYLKIVSIHATSHKFLPQAMDGPSLPMMDGFYKEPCADFLNDTKLLRNL